jgi:glutaconate CoA-transferase subunit A
MLWVISGVQKECVLDSVRSFVTFEEIVDEFFPHVKWFVLPSWVVDAVCHLPAGAHPSYAAGYSVRDYDWYADWDAIARDREAFTGWVDELASDATVGGRS